LMFVSFVSGAVFGIGLMLLGNAGMKTKLAFGPFLILGAVITMVFGRVLLSLWI
jgi:leader peptidase (prepilin peptidase)/N-methyltransferase